MKSITSSGYPSGVYSPLMQRLLQSDKALLPFHNGLVSTSEVQQIAQNRVVSFPKENRKILVDAIQNQYQYLAQKEKVTTNVNLLKKPNTRCNKYF